MILSLIFFLASLLTGFAVHDLLQLNLKSLFRYPFSLVIGTLLITLITFLASLFLGLNSFVVILIIFLFLTASTFVMFQRLDAFSISEKIISKSNTIPIIGLAFLFAVVFLLFSKSIFQNTSGIIAGNRLVWTDWPVHLAITNSFVKGDNFPPQNPQFAGENLAYPFFSDFLSSILIVLGSSLSLSYILPGIILTTSSILLLYYLGTVLVKSKNIAILGVLIALFWGGIGFVYFFQELQTSGNLLSTLIYPAKEYTFYEGKNLWFFSFLYSEILPQRSFLFGLPIFLISLILMIQGLEKSKKNYLLVSGLLVSILPFFHTHSYLSIILFCAAYLPLYFINYLKSAGSAASLKKLEEVLLYLLIPIAGLGLIQLPLFSSLNLGQTVGINWGWMKRDENFLTFWFKNTGFFWPLLLFAIFKVKVHKTIKNIALASIILFVLPNFIRFAPWPYDNLKIFTYWYLIGAFFVASSIYMIFKRGLLGKIIATLLFISLITAGLLEVSRIVASNHPNIQLWTQEDIELANMIDNNTEPQSVILTAAVHNHPATTLAGRKVVLGFSGNAWSWGYSDWQVREIDVRNILQANPNTIEALLNKYKIDYVLISSWERNFESQLNQEYFQKNYELVIGSNDFKLYKIQ
ncbi:hypothetical protein A3A54_02150 [Candidatus Curtissbacteria bacterium RIFCSPLOWO2_01_FULL_39_62]|uniref:Glycosyltransferase RgtA/B/C/D-like domain-containing protein n=2 Tax=Candidatus Curtissiibacteriota TaxID=1752717 RepID=A0A1F5G7E8_9BACT|nr:MAG: hypothetical protein A2775_01980 [Candidatus Curtissbacteria bacterium RIFCSPHIGHO2_01_FULL_39_57]OGD87792.1 MAG: hypothetical protein A3D04_02370 [Candidatus Curtissbacteria bacterium RIFCSPHIGHO2_02_FULL_40_16b]OGD90004.1 MAG: hypothetical protein A3E11_02170 [Candidatus Curtissbacteria bacterium RIFCSPHIGHO2_12_FULL_38_37]OGD99837.1 MAG: hypothetical protein A3J17_04640 [Candidatus Curtissbacteria bacterium RIFCSPLOWO2_02_FULL_40_11]OGE02392.1 MAG: hypothetical protein A3A54_02150 [C